MVGVGESEFQETVLGLMAGDFSRLERLFRAAVGKKCQIVEWYEEGLFEKEPQALAEAFTCACFNGCVEVVRYFLQRGIDPAGGINTGMNAAHWAGNRGQVEVIRLLIEAKVPLETLNMYGGTVLGTTVWSAIHEPRAGQLENIEILIRAGAKLAAIDYPTGHAGVDQVLRPHFPDA
jgi:hypothetical protein